MNKIAYKPIDKRSRSVTLTYRWRNRFEHWLVDNQVYFLTSAVRDHLPAFVSEAAKVVFWDRFQHYTAHFGFVPWVTSLMSTHYHTIGYLKLGANLPSMMQRLHGSVAKLVNDVLPNRIEHFWRTRAGHEYFDGCIRDERQARLAYRYTLTQAERHGIVGRGENYPHTRLNVELERAIKRANELDAYLLGVGYKRYKR